MRNIHLIVTKFGIHFDRGHYHNTYKSQENVVTILGNKIVRNVQYCLDRGPFEASGGLLDVFTDVCYVPIHTPVGAQAAVAHRNEKMDCGSGSHSCAVGCSG